MCIRDRGETPEEFKTSWGAKEKTTAPTPEAAEPEKVLEKEEEVATEEEEDLSLIHILRRPYSMSAL